MPAALCGIAGFRPTMLRYVSTGVMPLNEIRVDVYNTAISQLAEGGRLPDMKPVVDRYGLRTRRQDLDGLQPLPSGLLSPPRLVLER